MDIKLILKTSVKKEEIVYEHINFDDNEKLRFFMQGFLSGYAKYQKKYAKLLAYNNDDGDLVDCVCL